MPDSTPDSEDVRAGAFLKFAETAEAVSKTTKRLEKASLLAAYFSSLNDGDLLLAARYLAGYTFPLRDQRTTNVGGSAIYGAILAISRCDETWLRERLVALGDMGEAAEEAFAESKTTTREATLTLAEVATFFETLSVTAGTKNKQEIVLSELAKATPVEAKYLVKLLIGDLRIGLQEGAVEDAIGRWRETPVGQVQWANMLTGDIGETALLARDNKLDTARMRLFHPIKFMLATAAADLSDVARQMPDGFVVEDKFDGIRAQAHIAAGEGNEESLHGVAVGSTRVALFSRTLDELTKSYPDLLGPLAALVEGGGPADLILDGELLPVQGEKILPFQELQKRLGRKVLSPEILATVPVAFVAYDALYANGEVLITEPFMKRRAVLESLNVDHARTRRADSRFFPDVAALDAEFDASRARGNEGLMVKDPGSPYKPGRRGRDWLKIKRALATLDVVVTAVEVGNGGRRHLLSDYTFAVRASETDPTLLNVGKAYSGLTDAELAALSEWFRAHTVQEFAHGKVRVVEPKIVIEVTFDRVQASTRHKSGYALRFPRIVRVREDKPASEIDTLAAVKRLVEDT
ncbi:MAG TPA: ATP-dependent DNA ligase [Capsulimonadaceae bacterium]|nr:ATP-dependent DNA ligase [Capsulimonadaceae bacterium]